MKRLYILTLLAIVALTTTSCQKEEMGRVLTATIEQYEQNSKGGNGGNLGAAKAYINSDYFACWEDEDKVQINNVQCSIRFEEGRQGTANSAIIVGSKGLVGNLMAFYPAGLVNNLSATGGSVALPQVQTYEETTVNGVKHQKINNPMAAYCTAEGTELKFRNLCALLKVTLHAPSDKDLNIKSIRVKGNDNQMLWGDAELTLDNQGGPMLKGLVNGSEEVRLNFESAAVIDEGESRSFYIVVPAGSNFFEFTILVVTDDNKTYRRKSNLNQSLPRNHIGAVVYTPVESDKIYAIFYTGSIDGFRDDAFGDAQVLSNEDGILLFDRAVSTIGEAAFMKCDLLTSISLPAGVTTIGAGAFISCETLTSISLPAGVTTIGASAFSYCSSLTSISLPASLNSIGNAAFMNCSSLTSISLPSGVTEIAEKAFSYCSSLLSIGLPENLESIGVEAFERCSSLSSIELPAGVTTIGGSAFNDCSSLTSISLPYSVETIGDAAFSYCSNLTSIELPTSLTEIGDGVFGGCSALTSISLPVYLTTIGSSAFIGCSSLTSISLPSTVTSIGNEAFRECSSLTSIELPESLESIGDNAFVMCSLLNTVKVKRYSPNLTQGGSDMFFDCHSSLQIYVPDRVADDYKAAAGWSTYVGKIQGLSAL